MILFDKLIKLDIFTIITGVNNLLINISVKCVRKGNGSGLWLRVNCWSKGCCATSLHYLHCDYCIKWDVVTLNMANQLLAIAWI